MEVSRRFRSAGEVKLAGGHASDRDTCEVSR